MYTDSGWQFDGSYISEFGEAPPSGGYVPPPKTPEMLQQDQLAKIAAEQAELMARLPNLYQGSKMAQINPYYTQQQPQSQQPGNALAPMALFQQARQSGRMPAEQPSSFTPYSQSARQSAQQSPGFLGTGTSGSGGK